MRLDTLYEGGAGEARGAARAGGTYDDARHDGRMVESANSYGTRRADGGDARPAKLGRAPTLFQRAWLVTLLVVAATACSLAVAAASIRLSWLSDPSEGQRSRGVNALWAAHTWVGDAHSDTDYRRFAELLRSHEISDVFAHAGPLGGDGTVPDDRLEHARDFTSAMARYAPGVRVQAYLGQIAQRDGGPLDLRDPSTRDRIVTTAERMLDLGFEGIHYDIEPIYSGDTNFLDLLEQTHRVTSGRAAVLSVALEQVEMLPGEHHLLGAIVPGYHDPTRGYLRDVAARVDQIAIMTYDTGLPTTWLFSTYMAWQTDEVVRAVGKQVTVFMGVPTYDDGAFWNFHPSAENVRSGIRGVRQGLDRLDDDKTRNVGIAVFAEWITDDAEWRTYTSEWLRR